MVNEGTTSYHPITIKGPSGQIVTPESIKYKITGWAGSEIVAWTTVDNNIDSIEISATINTISATYGDTRNLTIEVTHNGGDKITEELVYTIRDLRGI